MRSTLSRTPELPRTEDCFLPLPAMLSQTFVAFAIEFDNEFEHRVPHRTTNYGSSRVSGPGYLRAPWLVSMAMWVRYLRHVPEERIAAGELQRKIGISKKGLETWLTRLGKWWGYLTIDAAGNASPPLGNEEPANSSGPESPMQPSAFNARAKAHTLRHGLSLESRIVRWTPGGRRALEAWRGLLPSIEARWRERFGVTIDRLGEALKEIVDRLGPETPEWFDVLEYETAKVRAARIPTPAHEMALPQLLAKAILSFAEEFERDGEAPLAACANLLRVAGDEGVRVRDLPRMTGLAKEGIEAVLRMAHRGRLATVANGGGSGRSKVVLLSAKGRQDRDGYVEKARAIEKAWVERFGAETVAGLRLALEELARGREGEPCPLLRGVGPYPDGWRAKLPPLEMLPHFPMVSHRGGFPDGA